MTQSNRSEPPTVGDAATLANRVRSAPGAFCGLDFDGTLAPIVTDPDEAQIDPAVVDPLERLAGPGAASTTVAVVSGRALPDLAERVPVDGVVLAGNHGLETRRDGERTVVPAAAGAREAVDDAARRLRERLAAIPGCRVEDKGLTLSVHVRQTPADRVGDVRTAVSDVVEARDDLRLVSGKAVFEVRPAADHGKGAAMRGLLADVPSDWLALYVGDDTTDEDAFRAIQPEGVGVHVGADDDTAAGYTLPDQSAVPPFLQWLADELTDE